MQYILFLAVVVSLSTGWWWWTSVPKEEILEPAIGGELLEEVANLEPVEGQVGSGIATRAFDGKTFYHTLEASLNPPAKGKFYEAWLVIPGEQPMYYSTGELTKSVSGKYLIAYINNENHDAYTQVIITEEDIAAGLDGQPGKLVLQGSFV